MSPLWFVLFFGMLPVALWLALNEYGKERR